MPEQLQEKTVSSQLTLPQITTLHDSFVAGIEKLFADMYQSRNAKGEIDFGVLQTYVSYNIGENYLRINSLLLQAQHHLSDLEAEMSKIRVTAIDEIKRGRNARGYEVSSSEAKDLLDGHPRVIEYQRVITKQTYLVGYFKTQLEALKFFPSNAKTLMELRKMQIEYGSAR